MDDWAKWAEPLEGRPKEVRKRAQTMLDILEESSFTPEEDESDVDIFLDWVEDYADTLFQMQRMAEDSGNPKLFYRDFHEDRVLSKDMGRLQDRWEDVHSSSAPGPRRFYEDKTTNTRLWTHLPGRGGDWDYMDDNPFMVARLEYRGGDSDLNPPQPDMVVEGSLMYQVLGRVKAVAREQATEYMIVRGPYPDSDINPPREVLDVAVPADFEEEVYDETVEAVEWVAEEASDIYPY